MPAPMTPFEARGLTGAWTTLEEEATFLSELATYSPKVHVDTVGTSVQGNPIRRVRIGTGPRRVVWISLQHGDEPITREALFTTLRQWVDSTDPALADYLSRVTVDIVPTCNPDRLGVSRNNSRSVNLNRDHLQLAQPESQAMHAAIRDAEPDLIVDWHEFHSYATLYKSAPVLNSNVHADIRSLSLGLHEAVGTAMQGAGYTWEQYAPSGAIVGPEYLHNNAGIRNAVGLLMESSLEPDPALRHAAHLVGVETVWRWHRDNMAAVTTAATAARNQSRTQRLPMTLQVDTNAGGPVIDPMPTGYRLNASQWDSLAIHRDRYRIEGAEKDGAYIIRTGQDQRKAIVYLMDPNSPQRVVSGDPQGVPTPGLPIPASGYTLKFRHNGVTYPATLKVKA